MFERQLIFFLEVVLSIVNPANKLSPAYKIQQTIFISAKRNINK